MNSRDKDFRYMATADLFAELNKETFKMDADSEKKITTMVLKLLEDNSNQVQELVVKWYVRSV
jgi:cullin-associated NEDD8-dissociated protein 1